MIHIALNCFPVLPYCFPGKPGQGRKSDPLGQFKCVVQLQYGGSAARAVHAV